MVSIKIAPPVAVRPRAGRAVFAGSLLAGTLVLLAFCAPAARAQLPPGASELLTNGNFEAGGSFQAGSVPGWTLTNQAGSAGDFFLDTPGTTTPLFGADTAANAAGGSFYAVTDTGGPWGGAHAIEQTFTAPLISGGAAARVTLSFQMFVNDPNKQGPRVPTNDTSLDYNVAGAKQFARVDLLRAGSPALATDATNVLRNFYLSVDPRGVNDTASPYLNYSFDISDLVGGGGTFDLRFAEVDNRAPINLGVDNVSIAFAAVPEPGTLALLVLGSGPAVLLPAAARRHGRRRA